MATVVLLKLLGTIIAGIGWFMVFRMTKLNPQAFIAAALVCLGYNMIFWKI